MANFHPLFDDNYFYYRPSGLAEPQFSLELPGDEILEPFLISRLLMRNPSGYLRPWRTETSRGDAGSAVHFDKNRFQVNLDVQQFKPEEITVQLTGENEVTVEGRHEEKQDEHGFIYRQFTRRYTLPKNCDVNQLQSKLSSDGVLTIVAPNLNKEIEHRVIPIKQTGQPAKKSVEDKKSQEEVEA